MTGTTTTTDPRGRRKIVRPLAPDARARALDLAVSAYGSGDYFAAHELLEPAWMGATEPAERELYGGLIKLAAAYVHDVRGNPAGIVKNLRGARDRLEIGLPAGPGLRVDVSRLLAAIDQRLAADDAGALPAPTIARTR